MKILGLIIISIIAILFLKYLIKRIRPFYWKLVAKKNFITREREVFKEINRFLYLKLDRHKGDDSVYLNGSYKSYELTIERIKEDQNEFLEINIRADIVIHGSILFTRRMSRRVFAIFEKDISRVGDEEFDQKIKIESNDSLSLTAILSGNVRELLKNIFLRADTLMIKKNAVILQLPLYMAAKSSFVKKKEGVKRSVAPRLCRRGRGSDQARPPHRAGYS